MSACVETYTTFNTSNYIYDIDYLEKKYFSEISIQPTSVVNGINSRLQKKQVVIEKNTSEVSKPKVTENASKQEEILEHSPTQEKDKTNVIQIVNEDQSLEKTEVKHNKIITETSARPENRPNNDNWLKNSFDKNLL